MTGDCQYVTASSVRVDIVGLLSKQATETAAIIDALDASSSAVYSALSDLETRDLVHETADGWGLTGRGMLVAETVAHRQATEEFLARDPEYWADRRPGVLPGRFRLRLPEIGDYEIMRAELPVVDELVDEIVDRITGVDSCRIATRIYRRRYEESIDSSVTQVLLTPSIVDQLVDRAREGRRETVTLESPLQVRVAPVEFGLTWSPESITLQLPPQTDARSTSILVSETAEAIQWGRDLHERLWADAQPLEAYLDETGVPDDLRW